MQTTLAPENCCTHFLPSRYNCGPLKCVVAVQINSPEEGVCFDWKNIHVYVCAMPLKVPANDVVDKSTWQVRNNSLDMIVYICLVRNPLHIHVPYSDPLGDQHHYMGMMPLVRFVDKVPVGQINFRSTPKGIQRLSSVYQILGLEYICVYVCV